jgi:hypothetical protein
MTFEKKLQIADFKLQIVSQPPALVPKLSLGTSAGAAMALLANLQSAICNFSAFPEQTRRSRDTSFPCTIATRTPNDSVPRSGADAARSFPGAASDRFDQMQRGLSSVRRRLSD